jgi:ABC-type transport system substrate-binding protein
MDVPYMYNASQASAGVPAEIDASYWQSTLKDAGLRLQLEPVQQAVWFQKGQQGQAPGMFYKGAGHFNSDPDEGLTLVFDPKSPRSPVTNKQLMGDDAKMLELMAKIKQELNTTARKQQVDEIQKHLSQRMYVIGSPIPLSYYFASKRLKNMYWIMHYAYGPIVADTWIDES